MHFLSMLIVNADSKKEARAAARDFIEQYQNHVYDWYVIGGRWSGYLTRRKLDQETYEKFSKEFQEKKLGWTNAENLECKQRKLSHELFMKYFPDFKGEIPVYRDVYNQDGSSDDVMPLSECVDIVKEAVEEFNLIYPQIVEEAKKQILDTGTIERYTAWKLGKYAYEDTYTASHLVFDIQSYTVSVPKNYNGCYVVVVDLHN